MKVLLDTNVILDVLADREPFVADSARVLALVEREVVQGLVAAHTVTTLFYLLNRELGLRRTKRALMDLLRLVAVVPVDHDRLLQAMAMSWPDFEDAVQAACAAKAGVDYLVTRNAEDFQGAEVDVVGPPELLTLL